MTVTRVAPAAGVSELPGDDFPADDTTAGVVVVDGAAVTGVLSTSSDKDWFAVELEANTEYRFRLRGDETKTQSQQVLDTRFSILFDPNGAFLSSWDNGDESGNGGPLDEWEDVTWTPTEGAGTYYVEVKGDDSGAYSLKVETVGGPADAGLSGLALASGGAAVAVHEFKFDDDSETQYAASVAGDVTRITVTPTPAQASAAVAYTDGNDMALTDADGNSNNGFQVDLGEGPNTIKVVVTSADASTVQTHLVDVERAGPATSGPTGSEPVGEDLIDDDTTTGTVVVDGAAVTGVLTLNDTDFFDGSDWFAVALTASTEYRFKVLGNPSVVAAQQVRDTFFTVYGSTGNELGFYDENNGGGPDSEWENETWTSTQGTGTYYVAVSGNDTGAYSLEVKTVDATLSDLTLTDTGGNGIDLSPTFAADEFSYTASVASDVATVTVAGTATDSNASSVVVTSDKDADVQSNVVDLSPGTNVITVTVTAEDGITEQPYRVTVERADADMSVQPLSEHEVPADWSLKPDAIGAGEGFRLMFVSSTTRDATDTDIAEYNTFVRDLAAAGHADIQEYSDDFRAWVSTETVNVRANTETASTDTDVPIYWVQASATRSAIAPDNAELYDATWPTRVSGWNESGSHKNLGSSNFFPDYHSS